MNIPIKLKSEVQVPPTGYVFPFIDKQDMQLKAKLSDGLVISYANVDNELQILSLEDYTAFQVFAHDYDIPVGECTELGGYVTNALKACMTHKFGIRSQELPEKQNVVIDWGDGNHTQLSNLTPKSSYYYVQHTYKNNG